MELALTAADAVDWVYRGEGAANLVLEYCGSSPAFVGKVLRVQKAPRKGPTQTGSDATLHASVLSSHERLLWKDVEGLLESTSKEISGQLFTKHVMSPLLGSQYIDAGTPVLVSRDFLISVEKNVLGQRPAWRVDAAKVNTLCDSALLISDHSVFPPDSNNEEICIAVEIKPKCGFLPSSEFIAKGNAIKTTVPRFRMHQALKLHRGEVSRISEYDPLDLFSGSRERINRAIMALFATPQNNFRVFLNGSLIFGSLGGGANTTELGGGLAHEKNEAFEDLIEAVILAEHGLRLQTFLELVAEAIFRSGILLPLLQAQKLDLLDIEGAIHAYYNIISQPCLVCKNFTDSEALDRYAFLHSLTLEECLKIVKEYLIAATAKDCSLMISFRPRKEGYRASEHSSIFLESIHQSFDYKAFFIDLDMKPLKKMAQYYQLDQEIVDFYKEKVGKIEEN